MNVREDVAPVFIVACPVHGQRVALDGDGHLLGRCQGCATEAAQGLVFITEYMTGPDGSVSIEIETNPRVKVVK